HGQAIAKRGIHGDVAHDSRGGAAEAEHEAVLVGGIAVDRGPSQAGAEEADQTRSRRLGLDRDEVSGERTWPALRDRERPSHGYPALPGRRTGAGGAAIEDLSIEEVFAAEQGTSRGRDIDSLGAGRRRHRHEHWTGPRGRSSAA